VDLKELLRAENKNGGRLRLTENTRRPRDGPLRLAGKDSRGRLTSIVGDEEFIVKMILSWPWHVEGAQQHASAR